ncbi:MAG: hypothetical protein IT368_18560 [Candidatus Hydrogenedentes bacterium]|nr:hypothetical protein [Candidatus Hydrogenedentota bacterium]
MMDLTRRAFLGGVAGAGVAGIFVHRRAWTEPARRGQVRRYCASVSIDALEADPDLLPAIAGTGVHEVYLACFFHGNWNYSLERVAEWNGRIRDAGMDPHQITIPLGHPSFTETQPDYTAQVEFQPWQAGQRPDGRRYHGVCLHPPGTDLNVEAVRQIKTVAPGPIFVDDDFRLAPSPDDIGGCFCDAHRDQFIERHDLSPTDWETLLIAVARRDLTPVLRLWLNDACDELTASFRAQQAAAAPESQMGIMVMYLGSEKAGIRLDDYRDVPFRVGELMFNDASFAPVKGKTNELFSALFHRRFAKPELAWSETTAWPPDQLSATNMAAKLIITTIADVRNTMFMSGMTPFPRSHWAVLGPAMKDQAAIHAKLAGHVPKGPFKHFWGEHSRWVGDANPLSLFLAAGVPFEVVETPTADGWTFLADADARAVSAGALSTTADRLVYRPGTGLEIDGARAIEESLEGLFAFKRSILLDLAHVPHIAEDLPVVCAWYPTARAVLLWNLQEQPVDVTLNIGKTTRSVSLTALGSALVEDVTV